MLTGAAADWVDVLAVYSVKVAGAEDDTASYVSAFDEKNVSVSKPFSLI